MERTGCLTDVLGRIVNNDDDPDAASDRRIPAVVDDVV